jgi:hypothetical protein
MIALVSMNAESDRVFVMLPEHAKRADHADHVLVMVKS